MDRWPFFLALGLTLMVVVNLAFAWIAVSTAPDIEPSYTRSQER
jgi:hypothetical protein